MAQIVHGVYSVAARVMATGASWWMRRKGTWSPDSVSQRYGKALPAAPQQNPIWIHAASMGEVRVGAALAHALTARGGVILVSAMTETGYEHSRTSFPSGTIAIRAPFDIESSVTAVLSHFRPRALVLIETELWPNMIGACAREGVRVFVVNGRLSDRAFPKYRLTRWYWRKILESVERFYMRSAIDAERVVALGATADRVEIAGSLKSAQAPVPSTATAQIVARITAATDPVWIAGSTRPGEEEMIFAAQTELLKRHPGLQLWIAPRHPDRFDDVQRLLDQSGLTSTRWSALTSGGPFRGDTLLVDAMGILPELYGYARVAFVGGSLKPLGGHNPLEPALSGTPVIFGPHMDTQRESADWLVAANLASEVHNASEIVSAVEDALRREISVDERTRRAALARAQSKGVIEHVADDVLRRIGSGSKA